MATAIVVPTSEQATAANVRTCYDLLTVVPVCGLTDFTDGKYVDERNDTEAYQAAQTRQAKYLLDQARCCTGSRLLDIGCGYGRILEQATRRGTIAAGITISPPQVASCCARGLDVRELDYRNIFAPAGRIILPVNATDKIARPTTRKWEHEFDAIIANGSLEHFVQVADALAGRADEIYEELFTICRRLLVYGGRFVTTAIHFRERGQFDPAQIARGPYVHLRRSYKYQYAMLVRSFGGWYPEPGQLERCAQPNFELIEEEDGTHDYQLTSEFWLRRFRRRLAFDPRVWWAVGRQFVQRPGATWEMLRVHLLDLSWVWQFRDPAPMRLLRQTWLAK